MNQYAMTANDGPASPRSPKRPAPAETEGLIESHHLETLNTLYLGGHVKALNWTKMVADAPAVGKCDSQ